MWKYILFTGIMVWAVDVRAAETVYVSSLAPEPMAVPFTADTESHPDIFMAAPGEGSAVSVNLGNGFRTQFEGLNSAPAPDGTAVGSGLGGVRTSSMMLHGIYEMDEEAMGGGALRVRPFIGAGVGVVDVNAGLLGRNDSDWVSAYQVRGGVNYNISQKIGGSFGLSWTEGDTPKISAFGIPAKIKFPAGGVFLGLNYKLP